MSGFGVALLAVIVWLDLGWGFQTLTSPSIWIEYGSALIVTVPATLFVMWAAPRFLRLAAADEIE
jgi:hypothetical protein